MKYLFARIIITTKIKELKRGRKNAQEAHKKTLKKILNSCADFAHLCGKRPLFIGCGQRPRCV